MKNGQSLVFVQVRNQYRQQQDVGVIEASREQLLEGFR
ncbi:MAG: hypothetical protein DVB22_002955 [Verrucomicrobia bacterium]|nr:MAG: hypothetical protein DVB22_002955 [Verrucomicrobiota bacterium]